jgi:hypothetical protein
MPFSVDDFEQLIQLLDAHPEWRSELRRRLLSDELLELPAIVSRLADAQAASERRLDRLEAQVAELVVGLQDLTRQVADLTRQVAELTGQVGELQGWALEERYRRHAPSYFGRLVRRLRVLEPTRLADQLDDAIDSGILTDDERLAALAADLVMSGRRRDDQTEVVLVVEVSAGIGLSDVRRAAERAAIITKLGRTAVPVVAGHRIFPDARDEAAARGVLTVLDGATHL